MTAWRYIAQRAITNEFLDFDVPMTRDELSWGLSGPGSLRGTIAPEYARLLASDGKPLFDEWGTLLYAEADGEIRWGGILVKSDFNGAAWTLEAAGFTTYPHAIPYAGAYSRVGIDPFTAVREIWHHVQSDPNGNLGMVVDSTSATTVKIGTTAEPYSLQWWDARDCGGEIDTLAQETPFDFVEAHSWAADGTISHALNFGYPRLGTKRTDLAFVQGDNVFNPVTPERDGAMFANEIVGLGAGEGSKSLRVTLPMPDGRLRRPVVYSDKSVKTTSRLTSLSRTQLARFQNTLDISSIDVIDHPNAPLGSWQLGDDILISADLPWLGRVDLWCRIVGWSLTSDSRATLQLMRSSSFYYGRPPQT